MIDLETLIAEKANADAEKQYHGDGADVELSKLAHAEGYIQGARDFLKIGNAQASKILCEEFVKSFREMLEMSESELARLVGKGEG